MAHFYNVTAHKPTAVSCAERGCFLSSLEQNLVLAKGNRMEVYALHDIDVESAQDNAGGSDDDMDTTSISTRKAKTLKMVFDLQLYGRIVRMHAFTPNGPVQVANASNTGTDNAAQSLFILTEKYHFCVLRYDAHKKTFTKRASGDLKSSIGRRVNYIKSAADPMNRMIAMYLCDGHIKILPMPANGGFADAFDLRLQDVTRLLDMSFLHGCPRPTLVLLHEDDMGQRHLKTITVDARDREFSIGPWGSGSSSGSSGGGVPEQHESAHTLIPISTGGVVVIGTSVISYFGGSDRTSQHVTMEGMSIITHTRVDDTATEKSSVNGGTIRYLLGNELGALYALALCRDTTQSIFTGTSIPAPSSSSSSSRGIHSAHPITSITLDYVGHTTVASTLTFMGENLLYAGSCYGDSQLVQLRDSPVMTSTSVSSTSGIDKVLPSYVEILENHTNVGPILDMSVVASERQGQDVLVTCSGSYGKGSLRVIRSGIGMDVQAQVELPGIKGMWSLLSEKSANGSGEQQPFDKYLVQSYLGETRVLSIDGESMEECELPGLDADSETLHCANLAVENNGGSAIRMVASFQITSREVRLLAQSTFELLDTFAAVSGTKAIVATSSGSEIAVAYTGGGVSLLGVSHASSSALKLEQLGTTKLDNDVACMSILAADEQITGSIMACGLWTDNTVRLLSMPKLTEITTVQLGVETQARDVLLVCLGEVLYLMVGLGDGTLIIYTLSLLDGTVSDRRVVTLGTKAISLQQFQHGGHTCVFATGDRPTVVHGHNKKLMFTVVNVGESTDLARFHSELFPNCLALASPQGLLVGAIDDIQRLHVQSHKVDGDPFRVAYHRNSSIYAVCAEKIIHTEWGESSLNQVLFLTEGSFEQKHSYELDHLEQVLTCVTLDLYLPGAAALAAGGSSNSPMDVDNDGSSSGRTGGNKNTQQYIVVGTAYLTQGESDAGRILVFSSTSSDDGSDPRITLAAQYDAKGPVYTVCGALGMIAAGINDSVKVFRLRLVGIGSANNSPAPKVSGQSDPSADISSVALEYVCGYSSNIVVLRLKAHGNLIVNGDLMRSISILQLDTKKKADGTVSTSGDGPESEMYELKEVARDQNTNYMRAIEALEGDFDDHYLGADDSGNIFCVRRRLDASTEEDRTRMQAQAEMHVGEYINVFKHGSLSSQPTESSSANDDNGNVVNSSSSVLYGTVSGAVGCILTVDKSTYDFFIAVQKAILTCVASVGGLSHTSWRTFTNDRRTCLQRNIVDGDVVETLLDSSYDRALLNDIAQFVNNELNKPETGAATATGSNAKSISLVLAEQSKQYEYTADEIVQRTEDMARMH